MAFRGLHFSALHKPESWGANVLNGTLLFERQVVRRSSGSTGFCAYSAQGGKLHDDGADEAVIDRHQNSIDLDRIRLGKQRVLRWKSQATAGTRTQAERLLGRLLEQRPIMFYRETAHEIQTGFRT
jgi:hypothetical protein